MDNKSTLQVLVHEVVLTVAKKHGGGLEVVRNSDKLVDLGLQSLDLAQIVAKLEMKTGLDPFMELVSITSVRTVGDLWAAYVGASTGVASSDADVSSGLDRAARRQNSAKA